MAKRNHQAVPPQLQSFPPAVTPETAQRASLRAMPAAGPVPVAPVAEHVQLTPIVQPLAFVPYSSQEQPLFMFDDQPAAPEAVPEEAPVSIRYEASPAACAPKARKGVKGAPIILILLGLLTAAVFVLGKFVAPVADYTFFYTLGGVNYNGIDIFIKVYDAIVAGSIISLDYAVPSAIALCGVFAVLTLLASLIRICKKGACVFAKITTVFAMLFALIAIVLCLVESVAMGIGLYIVAGLSFVSLLVAYLSRNK